MPSGEHLIRPMASVSYNTDQDIAVIEISNPPVNALNLEVLGALEDSLDHAVTDSGVKAVILIGGGGTFIAGVDIREIKPTGHPDNIQEKLFHFLMKLELSPKPIVAALEGHVLGGGLETAMAAHYRLARRGTKLGQPEVKLGLIPGAGGTQRLPRLVGVEQAIEMCAFGRTLETAEAKSHGLIDEIVEGGLLTSAKEFAERCFTWPIPRTREKTNKLRSNADDERLFASARRRAHEQNSRLLAPLGAIDAVEAANCSTFDEGCQKELQIFARLFESEQSKSLIHIFFAERAAAKLPESISAEGKPSVHAVSIVGDEVSSVGSFLENAGIRVLPRESRTGADLVILTEPANRTPQAFDSAPERAILLYAPSHFPGSRVVEISPTPQSSPNTIAAAIAMVKRLGKIPILTAENSEALLTRLQNALLRQARLMIQRGVGGDQLADAMRAFGFDDGPLTAALETEPRAESTKEAPAEYPEFSTMLVNAVVDESAQILGEGKVRQASDLDIVAVYGLGFPAFRGGPLHYADTQGLSNVYSSILKQAQAGFYERTPAPILAQLVSEDGTFARWKPKD